jgi:hypothetical protein
MDRDGEYTVWFSTGNGNGTGLIRLQNGWVSGGDAYITYSGTYKFEDEKFQAIIRTTRHSAGPPTWFGLDQVTIRISGQFAGKTAEGTGTVDQIPDAKVSILLMRVQDETPRSEIDYTKLQLHPERLPKLKRDR